LKNILHVLEFSKNLLNGSQFARDNNVFFKFHASYYFVKYLGTNQTILEGKLKNGLYVFDSFKLNAPLLSFQVMKCNEPHVSHSFVIENKHNNFASVYTIWHSRLGHAKCITVLQVLKDDNKIPDVCKACCLGKSHKLPLPTFNIEYKSLSQLVFSDIWGPAPLASTNGNRYYVHFIDACTKYT